MLGPGCYLACWNLLPDLSCLRGSHTGWACSLGFRLRRGRVVPVLGKALAPHSGYPSHHGTERA